MIQCPHLEAEFQKDEQTIETFLNKYKKIGERLKKVYDLESTITCSCCSLGLPFVWSCMKPDCSFLGCGRNQNKHSLEHFEKNHTHTLVINLATKQIWCYLCDRELTAPLIKSDKNDVGSAFDNKISKYINILYDLLSPPLPPTENDFEVNENKYKFTPGVCGLSNLGNTCYLNATLQALSNCPPLVHYFLKCRDCYENKKDRLVHNLANLFTALWSGAYSSIAPSNVVRDVFMINPLFRGYGQQDSQECLRCILDALHEALKEEDPSNDDYNKTLTHNISNSFDRKEISLSTPSKTKKDNSYENDKSKNNENSKKESNDQKDKMKYQSIVSDIFEGILLSRVRCKKCRQISDTLDPFYDLSLSIPYTQQLREKIAQRQEKLKMKSVIQVKESLFTKFGSLFGLASLTVSLLDCLHGFCAEDELTGNDKYQCEYCKTHNDATKVFTIVKPPEILCLHIKRFRHDSYFNSKLSDTVIFPLRNLDIAPFCVSLSDEPSKTVDKEQRTVSYSPPKNTIYDLVAVITHRGSIIGGHYVCYALNKLTQRWYEFDDTIVSEVSEEEVANTEAYVLFYLRRTPPEVIEERKKVESLIEEGMRKEPIHHVSKEWMEKWRSFSDPGFMSTRGLLCRHGNLKSDIIESLHRRIEPVPESAFHFLISKYGRNNQNAKNTSNVCQIRQDLTTCSICQEKMALMKRRIEEKMRIMELDRQTLEEGEYWYLISCEWLSQWLKFIKNDSVDPPGPISNHTLLKSDGSPKEGLQRGINFRGVTPQVWQYFYSVYGGGPPIIRRTINIYDEPVVLSPEETKSSLQKRTLE